MKLGYNTNGLAFHRWQDGLELLAETGFRAVALTLDHHLLDPFSAHLAGELRDVGAALQRLGLTSVIETGARFLLNPRVKHEPTLMSATAEERAVRVDFLKRAIDIAVILDAEAVSFWSGILRQDVPESEAWSRLAEGCAEVVNYAELKNMRLAFEPEPGMFIETFAQFAELADRVRSPQFGLTVDIGHVRCIEQRPISEYLREWSALLYNVHIEDMRRGVHDHLRFGEGEIDFAPVLQTLVDIGYAGCVNVELSRHAHMAPEVVRESYAFLTKCIQQQA